MFPDLERILGVKLPNPQDLHTDEARLALDKWVVFWRTHLSNCLVTLTLIMFGGGGKLSQATQNIAKSASGLIKYPPLVDTAFVMKN